jgi:hypothetical protein
MHLVAAGGSHLTRRLFAGILVKIAALPRPAGWGFLALTFKSREQKGDGETHPQIGHGFVGGGPGALETTRAVRLGAQFRSRPGARGTIACATAWSGSVKTQVGGVKTEIPDKTEIPAEVAGGLYVDGRLG